MERDRACRFREFARAQIGVDRAEEVHMIEKPFVHRPLVLHRLSDRDTCGVERIPDRRRYLVMDTRDRRLNESTPSRTS
jgi:hypothetical protein